MDPFSDPNTCRWLFEFHQYLSMLFDINNSIIHYCIETVNAVQFHSTCAQACGIPEEELIMHELNAKSALCNLHDAYNDYLYNYHLYQSQLAWFLMFYPTFKPPFVALHALDPSLILSKTNRLKDEEYLTNIKDFVDMSGLSLEDALKHLKLLNAIIE